MKKALSLLLALAMCLSLCACGKTANHSNTSNKKTPAATTPKAPAVIPPSSPDTTTSTKPNTPTSPDTTTSTKPNDPVHVHDWNAATCSKPKTCKTCGATDGTVKDHDWSVATCLAPKTCSVCKATEGTSGDHNYKDATCTAPKECKTCGSKTGTALGCTAGSDGKCVRCGKSMVNIADVLSAPMDSMSEVKRFVSNYYTGDCYSGGNFRLIFNSANGVILSWGATNTADKDIKYVTFKITYYNRVGDLAYDSITGKSSYTARLTGPVGAGKSFYFRGLIGYGSDIYYGVISDVKIEYMDGTTVSGKYGYTTWHNIRTGASPKECFIIEK